MPLLLSELCFTHSFDLFLFEGRELDNDSFRLHRLELIEIDVANLLVPQIYVLIGFGAFCEHDRFYLVRNENENSALSSSARDNSALFFYKATALVESYLHALFNHLVDRDQILRDDQNMQDILNVGLLTFFAE